VIATGRGLALWLRENLHARRLHMVALVLFPEKREGAHLLRGDEALVSVFGIEG
jgi:hypothetical protein